jgi:hypothetical protein
VEILSSPFHYPYYRKSFDVTGKRNPELERLIEDFINSGGFTEIRTHMKRIESWKYKCEIEIKNSKLRDYRQKQYEKCLDDGNAYIFSMFRMQTRYRQRNYQKTSYKIEQTIAEKKYSYGLLERKYHQLADIGFEANLHDYHSKNQRRLMTKQLRNVIAERDNYTCQICGKEMYDGVGLQIDHIIPIAKGGKSVPSNLQVLCSKCNGRKSAN